MTRGTWLYSSSDSGGYTVHYYAPSKARARRHKAMLQSLAGSSIEGEDTFLYCVVGEDELEEAITELEAAGFSVEEQG